MKHAISFGRDHALDLLSIMVPTKKSPRAASIVSECWDDSCEIKDLSKDLRVITITSDEGLSIDIEKPHEMSFSFKGTHECNVEGTHMTCKLGEPIREPFLPKGEFVGSFKASELKLHNIPKRRGDSFVIFNTQLENRNNHWYMDGMMNDLNEIHISPDLVKSVRFSLHHPMLTTAKIGFSGEGECTILADPKGIREKRKLYCK